MVINRWEELLGGSINSWMVGTGGILKPAVLIWLFQLLVLGRRY